MQQTNSFKILSKFLSYVACQIHEYSLHIHMYILFSLSKSCVAYILEKLRFSKRNAFKVNT